jgi:hypothetical protein
MKFENQQIEGGELEVMDGFAESNLKRDFMPFVSI